MKFRAIVSAVVLTLLSTAAFAQETKRPQETKAEQTHKPIRSAPSIKLRTQG